MNEFTPMIRVETSPVNEARELRDCETIQDLINSGVSVSQHDQDNWDKVPAGMVFRKIGVPTDMWYVNREYLNQTYRKSYGTEDLLAEKN